MFPIWTGKQASATAPRIPRGPGEGENAAGTGRVRLPVHGGGGAIRKLGSGRDRLAGQTAARHLNSQAVGGNFAAFDKLADEKLPDDTGLDRIAEFAKALADAKPTDKLPAEELAWARQVLQSVGGLIA